MLQVTIVPSYEKDVNATLELIVGPMRRYVVSVQGVVTSNGSGKIMIVHDSEKPRGR